MKVLACALQVLGIDITACDTQSTERRFERTFAVSGAVSLDVNTDAGGILVRTVRPIMFVSAGFSNRSGIF